MQLEAAERIVSMQTALTRPLAPEARGRITKEQRRLWDSEFPGQSFDAILAQSKHRDYDRWLTRA